MCTSGNGTCPKKALRASQSSTVLSLPMDHSIAIRSKAEYASRRMWTLRDSRRSRCVMGESQRPRPDRPRLRSRTGECEGRGCCQTRASSGSPPVQRPDAGPVLLEQRLDALEPIRTVVHWKLNVRRQICVAALAEPHSVQAVLADRRAQRLDFSGGEIRRGRDDDESRIEQDIGNLTQPAQVLRPCSSDAGDVGVDAM